MASAKQAATAIWAIAHSATYGYHIASLNGLQDAVVCGESGRRSQWDCLDVSETQFGFAVTIFTLGGLVGSLSADSISRRFDKVGALRIAEIGYIISALIIAAATELWMVIVGRVIIGISSGLVLVTIPPFLSQITPEKYHTVFGTLHQSSIGIGMLIAQSLSLVLAKPKLWRTELLIAAGIAGALLAFGFFVEDTEAENKAGDAEETTALLGDQGQKTQAISVKDLLTSSDALLKSGFLVVCVAQFAQQVCGISPVMFFSSRILQPVFGGDSKLVVLAIMGIGTPFNFLPGLLPSSIGSKRILLISALGTSLFASLLGIGLNANNQALSGTAVIGFVIAFSFGLAPLVAWVVLSEVVPPEARTAVGSVAVSINWLTNFSAGSVFLPLQQYLSDGDQGEGNVFFVFSGASLIACIAIWTSYRLYDRNRD